jgi:hypothetical protein
MSSFPQRVSLDVWTTAHVRAWNHKATMPAVRLVGGDDNDPILLFFVVPADIMG